MANEQGDVLAMLRAPLVYRAPGMGAVTVRRDISYRGADDGEPTMDVYSPPDLSDDQRRPAILFLHGGPISPEMPLAPTVWGVFRGYGALAAASGWIGVTFTHRFYGYDQLTRAADDIAAALAYLREHAEELHVDADRLCLWAFSGGGPFLADALREAPPFVRCLVAYYAVLDLRGLANADDAVKPEVIETLLRFSPVAAVEDGKGSALPMLVARAGQDHPALNAAFGAFTQAALTANMPLTALNHPAGYHSFDVRNDDARTREILDMTLAFLRAHLDR